MNDAPAIAGGYPVRKHYLIFGNPKIEAEEIEDVVDSLKTGWLGTGPKVKRFEDAFKTYVGARNAVALNSCTAALHLSLLVAGLQPGEEVITTPMSFTATAAAIIHAGARPVFVDVDVETMNIAPDRIESAITEKTRALLPVHFAGRPCDMKTIMAIAQKRRLVVIEDAAHAIETVAQDQKVGKIGHLTCFSFYVTKNIVTGEGGMVTTENDEFADRIKILGLHGMTRDAWHRFGDDGYKHYAVVFPGFKYNMMDIQAAIGFHQLKRIEAYSARRKMIWKRYGEAFKELPVIPPSDILQPGDCHAMHLYTLLLRLEALKISRDQFMQALHRENIGSGIHYVALHLHPYYTETFGFERKMFPNAEFISDRTVSLPLSPKMSDGDVDDVIDAVRRILRYYAK